MAWLPRGDRKFRLQVLASAVVVVATSLFVVDFKYVGEWLTLGLSSLILPATHPGNWSMSLILISPTLRDIHAQVADTTALARVVLSLAPMTAAVVAAYCTRKKPLTVAAMASLVAGTWFTALCWWWRILVLLAIPAATWYASRHVRSQIEFQVRGTAPRERKGEHHE